MTQLVCWCQLLTNYVMLQTNYVMLQTNNVIHQTNNVIHQTNYVMLQTKADKPCTVHSHYDIKFHWLRVHEFWNLTLYGSSLSSIF